MAAPMSAAQTRAQMKKWLVPFKEYSGWTSRKRPGSFAPVGLVIHHTGSDGGQNSASYDKFLFVTGRPAEGIPGPLCQASCEMDGDVILGAIGRANHAGSGSSRTLATVKADKASLTGQIKPGPDDTNGNGWFYGLEVKFDGGQPMTTKQYDGAVRWAAAICDFYKWGAGSIVGHKEWSSRKPDPGSTAMNKFRADVAARLKAGPTTAKPAPKPPAQPAEEAWLVGAKEEILAYQATCTVHLKDNFRQVLGTSLAAMQEHMDAKFAAVDAKFAALETNRKTEDVEDDKAVAALQATIDSTRATLEKVLLELQSPTDPGDVPKA